MCRREVPAFVLLRRLTFTSITTNDRPVLLLLPETLSSAPCKIATTFLKSKRIFKFFLFGKHHIHSSHTHFVERLLFSLRTKDEANGGVGRRGITPFGGGGGGKAEEEEEAKRVRPDGERRRRRNEESRSKAATEETARAFWIESVESHHQRV